MVRLITTPAGANADMALLDIVCYRDQVVLGTAINSVEVLRAFVLFSYSGFAIARQCTAPDPAGSLTLTYCGGRR